MKFGLSGIKHNYSKNSQNSKKVIGIIGHWSHSFGIGSATREMATRIEGNRFEVKKYDFEYFKEIVKTTNDKVFKRFIGEQVLLISALAAIHSMKLPQFKNHEKNPNYITYWWWEGLRFKLIICESMDQKFFIFFPVEVLKNLAQINLKNFDFFAKDKAVL
jgi:hypothetical protein